VEAAVYSIPSGSDRTVNWLDYFRLFPPGAVTSAKGGENSVSKTLPQANGGEAIIRFVHVVAKYSSRELASRTLVRKSVMNEPQISSIAQSVFRLSAGRTAEELGFDSANCREGLLVQLALIYSYVPGS
jgi:hypothetical protein